MITLIMHGGHFYHCMAPHNIEYLRVSGEEKLCFFET